MTSPKFCVNCKHIGPMFFADQEEQWECHHPKSRINHPVDLVTGKIREEYRTCKYQRSPDRGKADEKFYDGTKASEYACTVDAAWFRHFRTLLASAR